MWVSWGHGKSEPKLGEGSTCAGVLSSAIVQLHMGEYWDHVGGLPSMACWNPVEVRRVYAYGRGLQQWGEIGYFKED